jgi:hypothetical protein
VNQLGGQRRVYVGTAPGANYCPLTAPVGLKSLSWLHVRPWINGCNNIKERHGAATVIRTRENGDVSVYKRSKSSSSSPTLPPVEKAYKKALSVCLFSFSHFCSEHYIFNHLSNTSIKLLPKSNNQQPCGANPNKTTRPSKTPTPLTRDPSATRSLLVPLPSAHSSFLKIINAKKARLSTMHLPRSS